MKNTPFAQICLLKSKCLLNSNAYYIQTNSNAYYIYRTKTNDSKKKSEFIFRIKELYLNLTESQENIEDIPITILWRWIKHLIHTVKQLAIEKENNIMHQNNEENYKEYCLDLIHEFGLNDLDELKKFIDDLLLRNNLNIKKMQQLKNFLLNNKNYNSNA